MGQHREGAGLEGQGDSRQRGQPFFFYVGRAAFGQPAVEGILNRSGHALPDQDGRYVRAARPGTPGLRFELLRRHRQPELRQPGDEQFVAVVPGDLQPQQLVLQRALAGFEKVDEHVHGAGVLAGDLGAGHQLDARFGRLFAGGGDAVLTVVVGERERGQARLGGQGHELFWGVAPVGDGRVGVQVDHSAPPYCAERLSFGPYYSSGIRSPGGRRRVGEWIQ